MSYPFNYPTPQGANIQIFQEGGSTSDWVKPQGASFIWVTLIGGGGAGGGTTGATSGSGGGSAAVTNFMGPAFLIPDVLRVTVGAGGKPTANGQLGPSGTASTIIYQQKDTTGYTLLTANGGTGGQQNAANGGGAGGTASTSNYFSCMGFFQSVAGQAGIGSGGGALTASATTFLSGGNTDQNNITANYGYTNGSAGIRTAWGYGITQPIIVSVGGTGNTDGSIGGFGSGGGGASTSAAGAAKGGNGGDGMVVIITW